MSDIDRGLPEWANYLLKCLLIMIFPLEFYINELSQIFLIPTSGLLFTSSSNTLFVGAITYGIPSILSIGLRNFVIGIILAAPGIYFNYKFERVAVTRSSWKRATGFAAIIFLFTLAIATAMMPILYLPYDYIPSDWYTLYYKLNSFPTLVIAAFILYPLVKRQAVIIATPSDFHDLSLRQLESAPTLNLGREKMLAAILWFVLGFAPITIQINSYSYYGGTYFTGLLFGGTIGENWISEVNTFVYSFYGSVTYTSSLIMAGFLFILNFVFVRDIYRYVKGKISRTRFAGITLLSCFSVPLMTLAISFPVMILFPGSVLAYFPLPFPILQVTGLLIARFHHPHLDQEEKVWRGDSSRMWWEPERVVQPIQPIATTPERPLRHRSETIRVPISYRLLSRFRQLFLRLQSR